MLLFTVLFIFVVTGNKANCGTLKDSLADDDLNYEIDGIDFEYFFSANQSANNNSSNNSFPDRFKTTLNLKSKFLSYDLSFNFVRLTGDDTRKRSLNGNIDNRIEDIYTIDLDGRLVKYEFKEGFEPAILNKFELYAQEIPSDRPESDQAYYGHATLIRVDQNQTAVRDQFKVVCH